MKRIRLTKGHVALIDDEDYPLVSQYKWCASEVGQLVYAVSRSNVAGSSKLISMHRLLLGFPPHADHRNGKTLDNRRRNLRAATHQDNMRNKGKQKKKSGEWTSRYKGVYRDKERKLWGASICVNERAIYIGRFTSQRAAARAYDAKAIELFGEFARLNFPVWQVAA